MSIKTQNTSNTSTDLNMPNAQPSAQKSEISHLKSSKAPPAQQGARDKKIHDGDHSSSLPGSNSLNSLYKKLVNKRKATNVVPEEPAKRRSDGSDASDSGTKVPCDRRCQCTCFCVGCGGNCICNCTG